MPCWCAYLLLALQLSRLAAPMADLQPEVFSLDVGETVRGNHEACTAAAPYCTNPSDCANNCAAQCPPGIVPRADDPPTFVCEEVCTVGSYADHQLHACVSSCPDGAVEDEVDTTGDGDPNVFDCKVCSNDANDTVTLYADHVGKACVAQCPAGTIPVGNISEPGSVFQCASCEKGNFADRESGLCRSNARDDDKCPVGSVPDNGLNDCKPRCDDETERFWQLDSNSTIGGTCAAECGLGTVARTAYSVCTPCADDQFANHETNDCHAAATNCPTGSTADDTTNDCKHACPPTNAGSSADSLKKVWDYAANSCAQECPAGQAPTGFYKICTPCATGTHAEAGECMTKCPAGKIGDDQTSTCTSCGKDATDAQMYADQASQSCVANCPDGTTKQGSDPEGTGTNSAFECSPRCGLDNSMKWETHNNDNIDDDDCVDQCDAGRSPDVNNVCQAGTADNPAEEEPEESPAEEPEESPAEEAPAEEAPAEESPAEESPELKAPVLDLLGDTSSSTTVSTPCGSSSEGPYCNANCDTETPTCASQCAPGTVAKGGADIDRFNCDVSCGFTNATGQTYSDHGSNACVSMCHEGSVGATDDKGTPADPTDDVGNCQACSNMEFADHQTKVCSAECPIGSVKDNSLNDCKPACPPDTTVTKQKMLFWDTSAADGEGECTDACPIGETAHHGGAYRICTRCGIEGTKRTYADHVNHVCAVACPPGTVTTVFDQSTADSSDDTYDCVACGDTEFADHDAHECLPSNNSCPVGSTPDDEMNDCTPSCPAASQHAVPATAVSPDAPAASPEDREAQSEPTLGEEGAAGPSAAADGALAGLKMWNQVSKQCEAECPADQFPMTNGTVYLYCQTGAPTYAPSFAPSAAPSESPSFSPSSAPTHSPSNVPSLSPTGSPSTSPTESPSMAPSQAPTQGPSASPSQAPTGSPSDAPSTSPSEAPSASPSNVPSASPTEAPTEAAPEEEALALELLQESADSKTVDTPCSSAAAAPYCTSRCAGVSPVCGNQCGTGIVTIGGTESDRMNCNVTCGYADNEQTYADHFASSCELICPAGTVAKIDTNSTDDDKTDDVGDCTPCTNGHFADHDANECRSTGAECPAGSAAESTDTDNDSVDDQFDCSELCPNDAFPDKRLWDPAAVNSVGGLGECVGTCPNSGQMPLGVYRVCGTCGVDANNVQTFVDHATYKCVSVCPAGFIATTDDKETSDLADDTFDCTTCAGSNFADHAANACVEKCPAGSRGDDDTKDCVVCGKDENEMQLYADHEEEKCVLKSDCPTQDSDGNNRIQDDNTHDCGN